MQDIQPYKSPPDLLQRSMLWTVVCGVSALPSFVWAEMSSPIDFDLGAIITGILIVIGTYTLATGTQFVVRLQAKPRAARAFRIGYLFRMFLSALFPLGMGVDLIPGMISVMLVDGLLGGSVSKSGSGGNSVSFVITLSITLLQGLFLNLIGFAFMGLVYLVLPRRLDRQMLGLCENCGYDLRASYAFGRCPECGSPCTPPPDWQGPESTLTS
jgi:hypothetical protein